MSGSLHSPLARFVLFMIGLAILGTIIALVIYLTMVLPGHEAAAATVPLNICGPDWGCGPE